MTEKDARYWDEVAKIWQEEHPNTLWRAYSDAVNSALFSPWLPPERVDYLLKTDLFDESLGDGLYPVLAGLAKTVYGIDLSVLTVRAAKLRHNGLHGLKSDVRHLPFADGTFDVIVSNSTLDQFESSEEIASSLRELHRVLRVGGQLLLTLDNLLNPVIALRSILPFSLLRRFTILPYYVGSTLGPKDLRYYINQAGFEVLEVRSIMHFPRIFIILLGKMLEKFVGQRIQRFFYIY